MSWTLQALSDELNGQEIVIDRDMVVGRHQSTDIVLQSSAISRQHAVFNLQNDGLWLKDTGSSNGTFVNDSRIEQETLLQDQDIVQFAHLKFLLLAPVVKETVMDEVIAAEVTAAEKMSEQGMPSLTERADTIVNAQGMPQKVAIPVPAPIPAGIDVHAKSEPTPVPIVTAPSRVEEKIEEKKNASVGLISIIILIILALIAWAVLK
ncbi:FHA domain-containing protein [Acinetobacter sp. MD2]|uniref:FHA domain-containing protein n=1 Tax=Acinetobacter sp. MD2 TaxID=2600066 RepID=UPI002D1EF470|nr:FHA domain-containing protein [Acinetobacter sp. MD2]MEB3766812.1 FHA domain-containing protein [Acinetobacter sp. MD2]